MILRLWNVDSNVIFYNLFGLPYISGDVLVKFKQAQFFIIERMIRRSFSTCERKFSSINISVRLLAY